MFGWQYQVNHQLINLSDTFKIAHKEVDYNHFDQLYEMVDKSHFTFDKFYRSLGNERRKLEWLSIRHLLLELGVKSDIYYDTHGKPHFKDGDQHLSVSHSKYHIAVSLHRSPHGIDLQYINPKVITIQNKFLDPTEITQLQSNSSEELTVYWSMKEAMFKLYGKKEIFLKDNIRISDMSFDQNHAFAKAKIIDGNTVVKAKMVANFIDSYVLAYTLIP